MILLGQYLPLQKLQEVLPQAQLRDLAVLVRRVDGNDGADPISDRAFLSQVFEAYHGPDLLLRTKQRRDLLEYVPDDCLRELAKKLSLPASGKFDHIADRIAGIDWGANSQTKIFLDHFGYPTDYFPELDSAKPPMQVVEPLTKPLKTLRAYQASVFYRAQAVLQPPCARVMVQMPTGSGKTRTAMELVSAFLNDHNECTVLWLAHSEELCEQALESFTDVWCHIGKYDLQIHRCWGSYATPSTLTKPRVLFGGFKKLHSLYKSGERSPEVDLVIVDEAHMVLAPTFTEVVTWAKRRGARVLGLSATPGRGSGGDAESQELAAFFNEQIINIETDGEPVIESLQAQGILAHIIREPLHTNIQFTLTREEWKLLGEEFDCPPSMLKRLAENFERNRIIIEKLWAIDKQKQQTIVFATSIEQSKLLCALLLYRGIPAAHIDGSTSPAARRTAIARFKRREIRFLLNYQVLSTGFDAPGIDVVFIARPTKSLVLYSQMVGRGLRGPAVGGTATVRLIDVIDNFMDFGGGLDRVYDYFSEFWA